MEGEAARPVALVQRSLASMPLFFSPSPASAVGAARGAASSSPLTRPLQAELEVDPLLPKKAPQIAPMRWSLTNLPAYPPSAKPLQAKPTIGRGDDPLEREADQIAEAAVQGGNLTGEMGSDRSPSVREAPPIVGQTLRSGGGSPLDADARAYFEPRLGYDFSQVRVHADGRAARSARAVGALAYTAGSHVVFGANQYSPRSDRGRALLAHELVHVAQGAEGVHRKSDPGPESPELLAWKMREAFRGAGTDEDEIFRILTFSATILWQMIAYYNVNYNDHTGMGLLADLRDELSASDFGRASAALRAGEVDFTDNFVVLAHRARKAFAGAGTDEAEILRVLGYKPEAVRWMINYYDESLNDLTGRGFLADLQDEMSGEDLDKALSLLQNANIQAYSFQDPVEVPSEVRGEPGRVWVGLIVRGKVSGGHHPGLTEQHADMVLPGSSGKPTTFGYFGDVEGPASSGTGASIGLGLPGLVADFAPPTGDEPENDNWFWKERRYYVDLPLAKAMNFKSTVILIKVARAEATKLSTYWSEKKRDPGTFVILGKNCSTAAAAGFDKASVVREVDGLDTPDNLFTQLKEKYPDTYIISGYYGYTRQGREYNSIFGIQTLAPGVGPWTGPFVERTRLE